MIKLTHDIRLAEFTDIPELTALLNRQYNNKFTEAYFGWQYFNDCNDNCVFCFRLNGKIEGMFGVLPKKLNNGLKGLQAADMLLMPAARGKGYFSELAQTAMLAFPGCNFSFVLPNLQGRAAVERALGWETVAQINEWRLDIDSFAEPVSFVPVEGIRNLFRFNYTEEDLYWRFRNPLYRYHVTVFNGHTLVTKEFKGGASAARFLDLVYCSDDEITAIELSRFITEQKSRHAGATLSVWACPGTRRAVILKSLGFTEVVQQRFFCMRTKDFPELVTPAAWDLQQADTEFY